MHVVNEVMAIPRTTPRKEEYKTLILLSLIAVSPSIRSLVPYKRQFTKVSTAERQPNLALSMSPVISQNQGLDQSLPSRAAKLQFFLVLMSSGAWPLVLRLRCKSLGWYMSLGCYALVLDKLGCVAHACPQATESVL